MELKMSHVTLRRSFLVLITARGGGDWPPVLALAHGLADRGHSITVVCDEDTQAAVVASNLDAIPLPPHLAQSPYFARYAIQIGTIDGAPRMKYPLREWSLACLPFVQDVIGSTPLDAVVSSLFALPLSDLVSSTSRVPYCFVNPAYYFGDDNVRPWDEDFAEPSRSAFRDDFAPLMRRASLVLHATDPALDFAPPNLPARHHYVGPLLWELPGRAPAFLKSPGDPWVLVAVSTIPQPGDLDMVRMTVEALASDPFRILVTLSQAHERERLESLAGDVHVVGYIPHSRVLPECSLVVSHAGHGIVVKSAYHGVPMVLVPLGRDQPGVAARAAAAGVAEVITSEKRSADQFAATIHQVLHGLSYRDAASRLARHLQATEPVARACELLERFVADDSQS
jgi:UDP:flavonoid glycosyltransferase YjiC (YdhE family)